ncbi:hypothetical protein DACRYDRAFT_15276 [Dacryopinax primogenitus]|uniref:Uncharacterized protein n=1 Tax=Dacryopinax primogenitus (strain DJM 731) TaxID=1858805 RepID=M5GDP7_DACPD|nr:uncharacterized protein DACRYDRAFT_15276 [Dacryopinax primogenitus]EJU02603.1 hypothetical protein DACRYDRAFT_15276 [Dacryopinax primogenitus]
MFGHPRPLLDYLDESECTAFTGTHVMIDMEETGEHNSVFAELADADVEDGHPYPVVSFDFQWWFMDKTIGSKNLPRGLTQPVTCKFNPDSAANCSKAKNNAPNWDKILTDGLDLVGYNTHPYMSMIHGEVCCDVYSNYFLPKLFKLVHLWFLIMFLADDFHAMQAHSMLAFKSMGYIKADLMDQATASMVAKHTKEKVEAAHKKACDLACHEGCPVPPKPEKIEVPHIKQHPLAVNDVTKIPANHPLLVYAKAYIKWEHAEGGNTSSTGMTPSGLLSLLGNMQAQALQAVTSTPPGRGKGHAPTNLFLGMQILTPTPVTKSMPMSMTHDCAGSGSSFILPSMPTAPALSQPMTLGMRATTIGLPAHIFDAAGSSCLIHALGHGKLITANPTKSFSHLIFMCPNNDKSYCCMRKLLYNTCATCSDFFHDVGQEHATSIKFNLHAYSMQNLSLLMCITRTNMACLGPSKKEWAQHKLKHDLNCLQHAKAAKLLDITEQAWIQTLDKISINTGISKNILNANMKGRKTGYFDNKHCMSLHNAAKHLLAEEAWARGMPISFLVFAFSSWLSDVFYWALPKNQCIINSKVEWLCGHPEATLSIEQLILAKWGNKHLQVWIPAHARLADTVLIQDMFEKEASSSFMSMYFFMLCGAHIPVEKLTGKNNLMMSYKQFGHNIEDHYKVTLQGWPLPALVNPSYISLLSDLQKIGLVSFNPWGSKTLYAMQKNKLMSQPLGRQSTSRQQQMIMMAMMILQRIFHK